MSHVSSVLNFKYNVSYVFRINDLGIGAYDDQREET